MLHKFLSGYYYTSAHDFLTSLAPSTRYHVSLEILLFSGLGAMIDLLFGFKELTFVAFVFAAIIELTSGLYASIVVKKEKLESGKMGRFAIKILLWFALFFILNAFVKEYRDRSDVVAGLFSWLYNVIILWCAGEYIISILENASSISGKDKSAIIDAIKKKLNNILGL